MVNNCARVFVTAPEQHGVGYSLPRYPDQGIVVEGWEILTGHTWQCNATHRCIKVCLHRTIHDWVVVCA